MLHYFTTVNLAEQNETQLRVTFNIKIRVKIAEKLETNKTKKIHLADNLILMVLFVPIKATQYKLKHKCVNMATLLVNGLF